MQHGHTRLDRVRPPTAEAHQRVALDPQSPAAVGAAEAAVVDRHRCAPVLTLLTMITTGVASEAAPGR